MAHVRGTRRADRHPGTALILTALSAAWLVPVAWTVYTSLRPKSATDKYGYFSTDGPFGLSNYVQAWTDGGFAGALWNSVIITVPAVVVTLAMASLVAFAVSRYKWRLSLAVLILFTAGNMLPPQVLAAPLFVMYKHATLPLEISDSGNLLNTYYGVIIANVAFQLGFCTFVLSNYMRTLPVEITEAALMDGCGPWRMYRSIVLPLCRPPLAALAVLQTTWIYNDFFWPLLFMQSGDRLPITTAINSLQGFFLRDYNLISAGAVIALIPTLLIYLVLQRQFIAGLTIGATK